MRRNFPVAFPPPLLSLFLIQKRCWDRRIRWKEVRVGSARRFSSILKLTCSLASLAESVWFERSLPPAQVRCLPLKLMTSQTIQGAWFRTDGVGVNGLKELRIKSATSASGQWSICIRMLSSSLHSSRDLCFGQREKLSSASYLISPPLCFSIYDKCMFLLCNGAHWLVVRLCQPYRCNSL